MQDPKDMIIRHATAEERPAWCGADATVLIVEDCELPDWWHEGCEPGDGCECHER